MLAERSVAVRGMLHCSVGRSIMAPWLGKNVLDTGNPVYPLAGRIFLGAGMGPQGDEMAQAVHGPRPIDGSATSGRRWSTWPAGPTGSRRFTSRWLRWRSCGPGSRRLALASGCSWYICSVTWWLAHAPPRSILAADAAGAGGPCRPGRRLGSHA